jgi:hypothetical protein
MNYLAKHKVAFIIGGVIIAAGLVWYFKFRKPPVPEKTQAEKTAAAANLAIDVVANAKAKLGSK